MSERRLFLVRSGWYDAQDIRNHLSFDVQIIALLAAASTARLVLRAAVFALVFAAV
jgi:hypothetical protein